jgi:hypothetical protein
MHGFHPCPGVGDHYPGEARWAAGWPGTFLLCQPGSPLQQNHGQLERKARAGSQVARLWGLWPGCDSGNVPRPLSLSQGGWGWW